MVDEKKGTVKFIHKFPDDYRIVPANGAWGGISPRGDLLMHFFVEHTAVPEIEIKSLNEDGTLASKKIKNEIEVVRDMQFGVMLTVEQANSLAYWILDKVKSFEEAKAKRKEDE